MLNANVNSTIVEQTLKHITFGDNFFSNEIWMSKFEFLDNQLGCRVSYRYILSKFHMQARPLAMGINGAKSFSEI